MILKIRNDIHTFSDLRTIIAMQQYGIKRVVGRSDNMARIMKSGLSWQHRIVWMKNINSYIGKKGENVGWLTVVHNDNGEYAHDTISMKSERWSNKNNPGHNHGGRLSVYSKNNPKFNAKAAEVAKLKNKEKQLNGSSIRTLQYWINKGYPIEEAKIKLSEHQTTFSLKKCIGEHGKEMGLERWNERQTRWLNTLNNKTQDEIDAINIKKASKINYRTLWSNKIDHPGRLYLIKIGDNLKIGITTKTINERFSRCGLEYNIIVDDEMNIGKAFELEQLTLRIFKNYRFSTKVTTENFKYECLSELLIFLEKNSQRSYESLNEELRNIIRENNA